MALLFVFVDGFGAPLVPAAACAFVLACVCSYLLNKRYTFNDHSVPHRNQYTKYFLVYGISLGITLVLLHLAETYTTLHYLVSKVLVIGIVVFFNYSVSSRWVFTKARS